jgi:hypothetical protein
LNTIQTSATPVKLTGKSDPMFNHTQPCVVTNAPEAKEVSAMVVNTKKLMAA